MVKLIYDHRVLDGAFVARRLGEIEDVLNGSILDELLRDPGPAPAHEPPRNVEPLLKPHLPALATPQASGPVEQTAAKPRPGAADPA
jgi:hypothetical protein